MIVGHVRELQAADGIADRIDPAVAGLEPPADRYAASFMADAGGLQAEPLDIGAPSRRDQQMAGFDRVGAAGAFERQLDARSGRGPEHLGVRPDLDPLAGERIEHDGGAFRIVLGERARRFDHDHVRPQAAKRLRQLDPDRAAADHRQAPRTFGEIEDGLVGEISHPVEAGNRRHRRSGAGRQHEAPRRDLEFADRDRAAVLEARGAANDPHAEPGEALDRIIGGDRGDDPMHVRVHFGEIDLRPLRRNAERRPAPECVGVLGGGQQRFGRHAAVVEAVAPHLAFFDQHHLDAERRRGRGDRKPAGAGADHAEVGGQDFGHRAFARRTGSQSIRIRHKARPCLGIWES